MNISTAPILKTQDLIMTQVSDLEFKPFEHTL